MRTISVRASSWGRLFDCAHSWEGSTLLGLTAPTSLPAQLGRAIHASTAAFDAGRLAGQGTDALETAAILIDTLHKPDVDVDYRGADLSLREAESTGLSLHAKYCSQIAPRYTYLAVEMETKPLTIDCGNGIAIRLTGTLDRSRIRQGAKGPGIADLKTGRTATRDGQARTKGHKPQLASYELLYEHSTGQPILDDAEIIGLNTSTKDIATAPVSNARAILIGQPGQPGLLAHAAAMFQTGLFPPNPQSWLCSERYCARWHRCPYHD